MTFKISKKEFADFLFAPDPIFSTRSLKKFHRPQFSPKIVAIELQTPPSRKKIITENTDFRLKRNTVGVPSKNISQSML